MIHYSEYDIKAMFNPITYRKREKDGSYTSYSNNIIVMDTEVTSVWFIDGKWTTFDYSIEDNKYTDTNQCSWVYIWMVSIDGVVVYGRYIEEYKIFIESLQKYANTKLTIWVQNLGYEFQVLLRNLYTDMDVFTRKARKPMKCEVNECIYRDLFIYTNQSLENLGKHNKKYKKLVGDLEYNKLRFSDTPLNNDEYGYCENDVLVPFEYLQGELKHYKKMTSIPLTQTGKVRKELQKVYKKKPHYNRKCRLLVPKLKVYKLLKRAFQGGYTHANALYVDETMYDVSSWDFKSSYPAVMCCEKYPYSKFLRTDENIDNIDTNKYVWIGVVKFTNIRSKFMNNYISSSHCDSLKGSVIDNGRVSSAKELVMTLTNVDYEIIMQSYIDFDNENKMEVEQLEVWVSYAKYLDTDFVNFVLDLYEKKTTLKDVEENADLYARSKEHINSTFGMAVTNYVADEIGYNGTWTCEAITDELAMKQLQKLTKSKTLLTVYAHGVFITAYARRNLWLGGIIHMDSDVIYCDTDSIKFIGNHEEVMTNYNKYINEKMLKASMENDFDIEKTKPYDIYGNQHILGTFDNETQDGKYKEFRTMGAKRYAYRDYKNELHITISGVNKKVGISALNNCIEYFTENLYFDYTHSGKMLSTYLDEQPIIELDCHMIDVKYGITLRPTTYKLTMNDDFLEYIADTKVNYQISNERKWLNEYN